MSKYGHLQIKQPRTSPQPHPQKPHFIQKLLTTRLPHNISLELSMTPEIQKQTTWREDNTYKILHFPNVYLRMLGMLTFSLSQNWKIIPSGSFLDAGYSTTPIWDLWGREPSSHLRLVNTSQALCIHGGEEGGGGSEGLRWKEEEAILGK